MDTYNSNDIEKKWQKIGEEEKTFKTEIDQEKEKFYALIEFPYPSGQGLHVGHPRPYTALDIVSRKRRLQGYNVLYPIGWDAFGLPTENYAIKNKVHPSIVTAENIAHFLWIGIEKSIRRIRSTINGPNGYSKSYSRKVWLIRQRCL